jgi:septal ring factor EnvC (AmiA/AmiB activator)
MTDEEMRRTMQFILEQQAQFVADIQKISEVQAQQQQMQAQQQQQIGRLAEATLAITGIVGRLADAQERTERRVVELAEAQAHLAEAQKRTEERLKIFIGVVERYITEHRNGKE